MTAVTEKQRMLAGELYLPSDPQLKGQRKRARHLAGEYNLTGGHEQERRAAILNELLGRVGADVIVEPPFFCDYGSNIFIGDGVEINFGCVILDCNIVRIGPKVLFGPSVQVYAAYHPTDPDVRATGRELAAAVTIGENVWVGGGAIICPGVTIGENTTIGAGSVVVKDIPPNMVAAGNPCRVIREPAGPQKA